METQKVLKTGYALPPFLSQLMKQVGPGLNISFGESIVPGTEEINYDKGETDSPGELPAYGGVGAQNFKPSVSYAVKQVFPLRLKIEGEDWWEIPTEALISVKGKNIIVRRAVAKGKRGGTIKEYWTQDDFEITVAGFLINQDDPHAYPHNLVNTLNKICEAGKVVQVQCELLSGYGIYHIVIEDWDMPYTKGENIQAYSFKAYSDAPFDLLVEENTLL